MLPSSILWNCGNPGAQSWSFLVATNGVLSLSPPSKQTDKQWRPKSVGIKTTLSCKSLLGPTITTEHRWRNGGHWYNQIHRQSSSFACLKHCWSFPAYFLIGSYQNALCKYLSYLVGIDSGSVKMGRILKWQQAEKDKFQKMHQAGGLNINIKIPEDKYWQRMKIPIYNFSIKI